MQELSPKGHFARRCQLRKNNNDAKGPNEVEASPATWMAASARRTNQNNNSPVPHMAHDGDKWQIAQSKEPPYIKVIAEVATEDYARISRPAPKST